MRKRTPRRPGDGAAAVLLVVLLLGGVAAGCATGGPPAPGLANAPAPSAFNVLEEIEAARQALRRDPAEADRQGLHLRLATLLVHPDNPTPDYSGARSEVEFHLASHPADLREPAIAALQALLQEIIRRGRLLEDAGRDAASREISLEESVDLLIREVRQTRAQVGQLEKENRELKVVVERLKALEIDLENKRRQVR